MDTDAFKPKPESGEQYRKKDGSVLTVKEIQFVDATPYVLFEINGIEDSVYSDGWNAMELEHVVEENTNDPDKDKPVKDKPEDYKPEDEKEPSKEDIDKIDTEEIPVDAKLDKLHRLLNRTPFTGMPFSFPDRLLLHNTDDSSEVSQDGITEADVITAYNQHMKQLDEMRVEGRKKRAHGVLEFLWTCAGADKPLLRLCPHDFAKYSGIGGTILFTALWAIISWGYAANVLTQDVISSFWGRILFSIAIGLFGGGLIFNLDRLITNTMYSDGKPSISPMEIMSALPRIIIAVLLGIVISTPVELLVFGKAINENIQKEYQIKIGEELKADSVKYVNQVLTPIILRCNEQIATVKRDSIALERELRGELGTPSGYARVAREREDTLRASQKRLEVLRQEILTKSTSITPFLNQKKDSLVLAYKNRTPDIAILVGELYKISELTEKPKDRELTNEERRRNTNHYVRLFIMLFFITIEVAPVFVKMMMSSGVYDMLIDKEADLAKQKYNAETQNMINLIHSGKLADAADDIIGVSKYGKTHGAWYYINYRLKNMLKSWAKGKSNIDPDEEGGLPMEKNYSSSDNKRHIDKKNHLLFKDCVDKVDSYIRVKVADILAEGNPNTAQSKLTDESLNDKPSSNSAEDADAKTIV